MTYDEIIKLSKECVSELITPPYVVCPTPCCLFNLIPEYGFSDTLSTYSFYNGQNRTGELIIKFSMQWTGGCFMPSIPIYFSQGLYIEETVANYKIALQYLKL